MREVSSIWEIDRLHKEIELNIESPRLSYFAWGRSREPFISEQDFHDDIHARYCGSFIIDKLADSELPKGDYLCMHFSGRIQSAEY